MKLLLISNSTNAGESYLEHALPKIKNFLGNKRVHGIFIPYAIVTDSYDSYEKKVKKKFNILGYKLTSIHSLNRPQEAIKKADFIVVGGGNTFELLNQLYKKNLIEAIIKQIRKGVPYIGWSAGANIACPTIKTTNDMPIVEPPSFKAFGFVNFQINPHYTDKTIEGHGGESRDDRLKEFITKNKETIVIGLREGTALEIIDNSIQLIGNKKAKVFLYGLNPYEISKKDNLLFLLK